MKQVRSIFVSDIHLGCKYTNANSFLRFLKNQQPEFLYLVGDIVDGWRLCKKWYWDPTYSEIVGRLIEMAQGDAGLLRSGKP